MPPIVAPGVDDRGASRTDTRSASYREDCGQLQPKLPRLFGLLFKDALKYEDRLGTAEMRLQCVEPIP